MFSVSKCTTYVHSFCRIVPLLVPEERTRSSRAFLFAVPRDYPGCKNLRSVCLIVRISGRFFGPLISASELDFFCDARCDFRVPCYFWTTRRANEAENSVFDATTWFPDAIFCLHGANRIIDGNCQTKSTGGDSLFMRHVDTSLRLQLMRTVDLEFACHSSRFVCPDLARYFLRWLILTLRMD